MTDDRACGACGWVVPAFVPDYLVWAALGDHRANDCVREVAGEPGEVMGRPTGDGTRVLDEAASSREALS